MTESYIDRPLKRVLVLAYYFPPMGLSGVQRVAKFVKYLPQCGWQPVVLTTHPGGYFAYDEGLLEEVRGAGIPIIRTRSLDPTQVYQKKATVALPDEKRRRTLSTLSQWLFVPDNKVGWWPFAVQKGKRLHQERPFDLIFSSAPPYTAHLVGAWLQKKLEIPLLLDFRDDWVGNPRHVYPTAIHRILSSSMERWAMGRAQKAFTINHVIQKSLADRSPNTPVHLLSQGYDAEDFKVTPHHKEEGRLRFVYSGIFYDAQTPDYFLRALALVVKKHPHLRPKMEAVFVGLLPDKSRQLASDLGVEDVIQYVGYVPHEEAVAYQRSADVLWMTIGTRPGAEGISTSKLFEYYGARRPILALVPPGAAREALKQHGAAYLAAPEDVEEIASVLETIVNAWVEKKLPSPNTEYLTTFDREHLTAELAAYFDAAYAASKK